MFGWGAATLPCLLFLRYFAAFTVLALTRAKLIEIFDPYVGSRVALRQCMRIGRVNICFTRTAVACEPYNLYGNRMVERPGGSFACMRNRLLRNADWVGRAHRVKSSAPLVNATCSRRS